MNKKPRRLRPLLTRWGASLDKSCPHCEYPRPQLERENWMCLNGLWQYAIRDINADNEPDTYNGDIVVPFSPESLLSGVSRQLLPGQTLWYRRAVHFDNWTPGKRLLLHFGAVDQRCTVYLNGYKAGGHEGGYWPFCMDITDFLRKGENIISVAVTDDSDTGLEAYGKQKLDRGGIWYTAQSGIWQTVWAEAVPEQYIKNVLITPLYGAGEVKFQLTFSRSGMPPESYVQIFAGDSMVAQGHFDDTEFCISLPGFRSWSPDDPFLYTVKITAGEDEARSYFGMREFGVTHESNGMARLSLNGKPVFHSGLLDQGYWSDGLYTPPSDEALVWELTQIKRMGFNMLRKHIKIEPLRYYYHCDRLGILVWQDFVSGGGPYRPMTTQYLPFIGVRLKDDHRYHRFGRQDKASRAIFERDMERTVALLKNTVSIAVWVPFNEGWGQFDSRRITDVLRKLDDTRGIDHASGWHDQGCGDLSSYHVYYKRFRMKPNAIGRVQALTEFGGYSCPTDGHMSAATPFGYRMYKNKRALTDAFRRLYQEEVLPNVKYGLSAAVYTQVSDVEDEINGLFTYDRAVTKLDEGTVLGINQELLKNSSGAQ